MDLYAKESAALREIGHEQALMREEQHGKLAEDLLVNKTSGRKVADEPQENDALWVMTCGEMMRTKMADFSLLLFLLWWKRLQTLLPETHWQKIVKRHPPPKNAAIAGTNDNASSSSAVHYAEKAGRVD